MGAKFFLSAIFFFFAFMKLSAQVDGVHLRMQMHPVQVLSVGSGDGIQRNAADNDQNFITVSSTSGFEVNMYRRMNEDEILNVVNSNRGAVQKSYTIDDNISRLSREFDRNPSAASDNLILTLISR